MREDTRTGECCRGWDSPPSQPSPLKGEGVYRGQRGWVPACANRTYGGVLSGMGFTPIPTFPPCKGEGVYREQRGWVPACARTTRTGECCRGWDSPPSQPSLLKGEGVYRGQRGWVPACAKDYKMGPRMREDNGIVRAGSVGWAPHAEGKRVVQRRTALGPRMREDNGRGMGGCRADACLKLGMGVESQR